MERVTEYFSKLIDAIRNSSWLQNEDLTFREIDEKEGYIRGILFLHGGYTLHIAEYISVKHGHPERIKYRYQLQNIKDDLLARWDNAPHHKKISSYPYHKHCEDGEIDVSAKMDILLILSKLDDILKDKI